MSSKREIERKFLVVGDGWRKKAGQPSTIVQAEAHRPSIMTVSPEVRSSWYLST